MYKPHDREDVIWLHPGEPVFDKFSAAVLSRSSSDAIKGAVFVDPDVDEPYLLHLALLAVEKMASATRADPDDLLGRRDVPGALESLGDGRVPPRWVAADQGRSNRRVAGRGTCCCCVGFSISHRAGYPLLPSHAA